MPIPHTIDAHQHFWTFEPSNYNWIEPWMTPLRRDIDPALLRPELELANIDGTIAVEARGNIEETENLLNIADRTDFVRGVVGWLPFADSNFEALLDKYAANKKLCGIRHAINVEPDPTYMDREDFNAGIRLLKKHDLAYDLSFQPPQLSRCLGFVDRHPDQTFIIDHLAKPYIREKKLEPWKSEIEELAKRPNVFCKTSGLTTEADMENWIPADLDPYLNTVLEAFTPARLMFGSDWPVCLLGTSYQRWKETIDAWIAPLSESEQQAIMGGTTMRAYKLT